MNNFIVNVFKKTLFIVFFACLILGYIFEIADASAKIGIAEPQHDIFGELTKDFKQQETMPKTDKPPIKSNSLQNVNGNTQDTWLDYAADSFEAGDGSKKDPYLIKTAEQLALLARQVNSDKVNGYSGKYFKLVSDINLKEREWTPIGIYWHGPGRKCYFQGELDGNGAKIIGLTVNKPVGIGNHHDAGLFDVVGEKGVLKNLNLVNIEIDVNVGFELNQDRMYSVKAGALVVYNYGTITKCTAEGSINVVYGRELDEWNSLGTVGGLVNVNFGHITGCIVNVNVKSGGEAGGLVASNGDIGLLDNDDAPGFVVDCSSLGSVTGRERVGGLIGINILGNVSKSKATGAVSSEYASSVGGLIGANFFTADNIGVISDCEAFGDVTGNVVEKSDGHGGLVSVGGLVGYLISGAILNCSAKGNVTSQALGKFQAVSTGGLVGSIDVGDPVSNCTASGSVSGNDIVGGLIGSRRAGYGQVLNCKFTGKISGKGEYTGELIGLTVAMDDDFWDARHYGVILR
jgi:hypothetical protein